MTPHGRETAGVAGIKMRISDTGYKVPDESAVSHIPADYTSAVLSNPLKKGSCAGIKDCIKVRIRKLSDSRFFAEFFTETQVFHRCLEPEEFRLLLQDLPRIGTVLWRHCLFITAEKEVRVLTNKKGKSTVLTKLKPQAGAAYGAGTQGKPPEDNQALPAVPENGSGLNRQKDYIIGEGSPVPFLTAHGLRMRK